MEHIIQLMRKGVAELRPRSFGPPVERLKEELGLEELINLGLNENPLGASPQVQEQVRAAVQEINRYPDPAAHELRSLIAEKYGVSVDHVLPGSGACELITMIGDTFLNEGDETITPDPTFGVFRIITQILGGTNILSPLKQDRIDLDDIASKITPKTKLIIIVNPNNPTGDMLRKEELDPFVREIAQERIVVLDEAYAEYADLGSFPNSIGYLEQGLNVIIMRTFSKVYGLAGLRVGYALANPEIIRRMDPVRHVFNVNRLAQVAAIAALKDKDHLLKCVDLIQAEKQFYYDAFDTMGISYIPSQTNFIMLDAGVDGEKLCEAMRRKGILISTASGNGYQNYVRITIGTHDQNVKTIACIKELLNTLH